MEMNPVYANPVRDDPVLGAMMQDPIFNDFATRTTSNPVVQDTNTTKPQQIPQQIPTGPTAAQIQAAQEAAQLKAQADAILKSIGALDTVRSGAYESAQSQYNKNIKGYEDAEKSDLEAYTKQVGQNEGNLASNRQAALLQAAQSGRGLRSVLAALGALGGTGSVLADRAVSQAANQDIGEAQNAFETSADTLTGAYKETEREQRQRREDARAALENEKRAADLARYQGQQSAYTDLANLYGLGTAQGNEYSSKAAQLYPQIASSTKTSVGSYAAPKSLYSEQALEQYKGGVKELTVDAKKAGAATKQPQLTAFYGDRKRDEEVV